MNKQKIESSQAPQAIGPYSQAIRSGGIVYLSGQIPLDPATMMLVEGDMTVQTRRVFANLQAVCEAAGGGLEGIVKLTIYLTDLAHFPLVNDVMKQYFTEPYPARVTVQVSALPKAAQIEMDAVMVLA
ncbi:2-iminobutanoate/2-iminopropanoate deaminase [Aquicella siphonis]|uniref:2-iminobutanoate/2-iminopropanoate deaminase n=1 Tax=Aquicella siphonis TaxID=254247 RepID=A0A5E4PDT5_9COXI|nr:RidA family protein [Aquicella siphonis]VVC75119.1 2-iminobutanoate/2-iminopropanoate deaminase [Aquicella siphonis]